MFVHLVPKTHNPASTGMGRVGNVYTMFQRSDKAYVVMNTAFSPHDPLSGEQGKMTVVGRVSKPHHPSIVTRECSHCDTSATSDALITHCAVCGTPY